MSIVHWSVTVSDWSLRSASSLGELLNTHSLSHALTCILISLHIWNQKFPPPPWSFRRKIFPLIGYDYLCVKLASRKNTVILILKWLCSHVLFSLRLLIIIINLRLGLGLKLGIGLVFFHVAYRTSSRSQEGFLDLLCDLSCGTSLTILPDRPMAQWTSEWRSPFWCLEFLRAQI